MQSASKNTFPRTQIHRHNTKGQDSCIDRTKYACLGITDRAGQDRAGQDRAEECQCQISGRDNKLQTSFKSLILNERCWFACLDAMLCID